MSKRNLKTWADELTHPNPLGFDPSRTLGGAKWPMKSCNALRPVSAPRQELGHSNRPVEDLELWMFYCRSSASQCPEPCGPLEQHVSADLLHSE